MEKRIALSILELKWKELQIRQLTGSDRSWVHSAATIINLKHNSSPKERQNKYLLQDIKNITWHNPSNQMHASRSEGTTTLYNRTVLLNMRQLQGWHLLKKLWCFFSYSVVFKIARTVTHRADTFLADRKTEVW